MKNSAPNTTYVKTNVFLRVCVSPSPPPRSPSPRVRVEDNSQDARTVLEVKAPFKAPDPNFLDHTVAYADKHTPTRTSLPPHESPTVPLARPSVLCVTEQDELESSTVQKSPTVTSEFSSDSFWATPPPTDPSEIAELWEMATTKAKSAKSAGNLPSVTEEDTLETDGVEEVNDNLQGLSINEQPQKAPSRARSAGSNKPKRTTCGPRDSNFRERVLAPRGIQVIEKGAVFGNAFTHFSTKCPKKGYTSLDGLKHITIWLHPQDDELGAIGEEYIELAYDKANEAAYSSFAMEQFLRRPQTARMRTKYSRNTYIIQRVEEAVIPPKPEEQWHKPPLVPGAESGQDSDPYEWTWDIRADCAYMVSKYSFNPKWHNLIKKVMYVYRRNVSSYFTVEFKRDDETSTHPARNQLLAAASLTLYNRFLLRKQAVNYINSGGKGKYSKIEHLKHYGMTFVGGEIAVWIVEPKLSVGGNTWLGCTMTPLDSQDLENPNDSVAIADVCNWINEIHRWAATVYGPALKCDLKSALSSHKMPPDLMSNDGSVDEKIAEDATAKVEKDKK